MGGKGRGRPRMRSHDQITRDILETGHVKIYHTPCSKHTPQYEYIRWLIKKILFWNVWLFECYLKLTITNKKNMLVFKSKFNYWSNKLKKELELLIMGVFKCIMRDYGIPNIGEWGKEGDGKYLPIQMWSSNSFFKCDIFMFQTFLFAFFQYVGTFLPACRMFEKMIGKVKFFWTNYYLIWNLIKKKCNVQNKFNYQLCGMVVK